MERSNIVGIALLIASIATGLTLAILLSSNTPFDDPSWLAMYLSKEQDLGSACYRMNPLDGACSSVIVYSWISARILGALSPYGSLVFLSLTIIAVFYVAKLLFRNPIIAGLSSLIYASTPSIILWMTPVNTGYHTLSGLLTALLLALLYYVRNPKSIPLLLLVGLLIQMLHPMGWLIIEALIIGLAAWYVLEGSRSTYRYAVASLGASSIPPLLTPWLNIPALLPLASSILLLIVDALTRRQSIEPGKRLVSAVLGIATAILVSIVAVVMTNTQGYTALFSKSYNPVIDHGVIAATGLVGLIALSRSRLLGENPWMKSTIISLTIVLIAAPLYDPTLTVVEALPLSILSALILQMVASQAWFFRVGKVENLLYRASALLILLGVLSGNIMLTVAETKTQPFIYTYDLQGYSGLGRAIRNESAWLKALDGLRQAIENASASRVLVVSYWGYTYWIQGALSSRGIEVYTLAHDLGGEKGKYMISSIMLGNEATAKQIIGNISSELNVDKAYVVVSYLASIRLVGGNPSNNTYLGVAIPIQTQQYYEQTYYGAAGDLSRLILYINTVKANYMDYINTYNARTGLEMPLAWSSRAYNSLLVKLTVDSLNRLGYTVYNQLYSYTPLSSSVNYFKPVVVTASPVMRVSGLYSEYEIIHVVAVYEYLGNR